MDTKIFRTWDRGLRAARHARLSASALAAAQAASESGCSLMVTGSLSRGEVHPWSDLDLVLVGQDPEAEPDSGLSWKIKWASGLADEDAVDVMSENQIIEPLRKGILGSLVPVGAIPDLGDLPDPELALPRAAVSIETAISQIEAARLADGRFLDQLKDDSLKPLVVRSSLSRARDQLAYRTQVSLKRLAVFQDGGRSEWLDSHDDDDLPAMLERLAAPAGEPFERAAALTAEAADVIPWLLGWDDRGPPENEKEAEALEKKLLNAITVFKTWTTHLRAVSTLTETHGLRPGR